MNALVIVDPQNDFINGSLAVPGAEKAINNTIEFIKEHKEDLDYIAITVDWHPYDHCSFKEYGGTWESHCVMYSAGVMKLTSCQMNYKQSERKCVKISDSTGKHMGDPDEVALACMLIKQHYGVEV